MFDSQRGLESTVVVLLIMHDIMLDRLIKFLGPPGESEDREAVRLSVS